MGAKAMCKLASALRATRNPAAAHCDVIVLRLVRRAVRTRASRK